MSWEEFLEHIAREHGLTPDQKEAFIARFDQTEQQAADSIKLELPAFKQRMKDVYKKFAKSCPEINFSHERGKFEKLVSWLQKEYNAKYSHQDSLARKISHLPDIVNPFGIEGKINSPENFFNREEVLDSIFEALNKGGNRTIVGEKQVGKSSILSMVCNLGLEKLKFTPESFVYLDMRNIYDENDFFEALCTELNIETCRGFQLARKLGKKHYVLCLDTFEKQRQECFRSDMWSELRGLADGDSAPFKLVIASRSPLSKLLADYSGKTSPLDDICREINVEPFSPNVACAFLKHRLKGTGIFFTESQINQLIEETQGHPARLQQAAADLYRSLTVKP